MLNQTVSPAASDVNVIRQVDSKKRIIKVGAYCRVSTNLEIQKSSMELQMAAYQRIIDAHPGWELVGIYADKGLSGTSVKHRVEFVRMIEDAKAGKLDYILVKSISRFSRNTVDLLNYIRELSSYGVHVFFEKEHLDSGSNSEFLITLFGAHAQEEIISLSENMKVGRRMRFAKGEQQWANLYGYAKGWVIVEKQAKVIRRIYDEYLRGISLTTITNELNDEGIPTSSSKGKWAAHTVSMMMRNEKYAGHLLMQKTYVLDPIQHIKVNNRDAFVPQYFKANHHPAIVSNEEWEAVKTIMTMRDMTRGTSQYPYYGLLRCPFCGSNMVRFHYSKDDYYWTCGGEKNGSIRKKRSSCPPYYVHDAALNEAVQSAGLPLEYWPLSQRIQSISFPSNDWNTLVIPLKGNDEDLRVPIHYDLLSNHPLPVLSEKTEDHGYAGHPDLRTVTYVDGKPLSPSRRNLILQRIESLRETVLNLSITPAEPYEDNVPKVKVNSVSTPKNNKSKGESA